MKMINLKRIHSKVSHFIRTSEEIENDAHEVWEREFNEMQLLFLESHSRDASIVCVCWGGGGVLAIPEKKNL